MTIFLRAKLPWNYWYSIILTAWLFIIAAKICYSSEVLLKALKVMLVFMLLEWEINSELLPVVSISAFPQISCGGTLFWCKMEVLFCVVFISSVWRTSVSVHSCPEPTKSLCTYNLWQGSAKECNNECWGLKRIQSKGVMYPKTQR